MLYKKYYRKVIKRPSNGQMNLIGDIFKSTVKYAPRASRDPQTGLAVVVTRIPAEATDLERLESKYVADNMASNLKQLPKYDYGKRGN